MEWATAFNQKMDNHLYYATKEREGWNRMHIKMEEEQNPSSVLMQLSI